MTQTLGSLRSQEELGLDGKALDLTWLREVQRLTTLRAPITDAGLKELHALKNLRMLSLFEIKGTAEGVKTLRETLSSCRIFP